MYVAVVCLCAGDGILMLDVAYPSYFGAGEQAEAHQPRFYLSCRQLEPLLDASSNSTIILTACHPMN